MKKESNELLIWKADDIPCCELPESFYKFLRSEGVID